MLSQAEGARKVIGVCGDVHPGERVLVLYDDPGNTASADALRHAAVALGATADIQLLGHSESDLFHPVATQMRTYNLVVAMTGQSVAHSPSGQAAAAAGARVLAMTGADETTLLTGGIQADFLEVAPRCERLASLLGDASTVTVRAPGGTGLTASLAGRAGIAGTALAHKPGAILGCPDIEAYIAPVEGTANGVVVIDGSSTTFGVVDEPIRITVEQGRAVSIDGGSHAYMLTDLLASYDDRAVYVLAEVGIGMNPAAELVGRIIEDEAVYGTGHFAFGSNVLFAGANPAPIHMDLVYWHPTVTLDGVDVMREGVLL